ncbi:MAG: nucleoside-triphosphatase [Bacteroidales bacterium]|nr:nucleoside-triphosphatase [Bacteroidales bacterium]
MTLANHSSDRYIIDARWIKASVAGSMWAASEIVIGSFLHNLRVPFSGSILTAIGVILLISISYKWKNKGLFWRAGLICALMKTLSPSAVIFGPMIAIIIEALILEMTVRLLGRNPAGYITGAVLAMTWSLIQRILTLMLFYGTGIIEVYSELADMAEKQTGIQADMAWLPIIIILVIDAAAGIISALAGIRLGRQIIKPPTEETEATREKPLNNSFGDPGSRSSYSIAWLFTNLLLISGSMIILNYTDWIIWVSVIPLLLGLWISRYKRAMRQLLNPKFWIFFIIITLLTSFVFVKAGEGDNILAKGLMEGLRMNLRAAVIILGFSATGTELYNPVIRKFFRRTAYRNLPIALEMAAESLPAFIAGMPSLKTIMKKPVPALNKVMALAEKRLRELERENAVKNKLFIISGPVAGGKTTYARKLVTMLVENDIDVSGILTERIMSNNKTTGYDILDIKSSKREIFLRAGREMGPEKTGRYSIHPAGLQMGKNILCNEKQGQVTVIDEVGKMELEGRGWAQCLQPLFNNSDNIIIITVRDSLTDQVMNKWGTASGIIFNIARTDIKDAYKTVSSLIPRETSVQQ